MNNITSTTRDSRSHNLSEHLNTLGLLGISGSLIIAFYYQFALNELPCPLCLLQRVGMIAIGIGFLMNIRFGIRSAHYGIALLGCFLTGAVAIRQMFLHIMPGDAGYGLTFLGLHFYTLAVLSALAAALFIVALLFLKSYEQPVTKKTMMHFLGKAVVAIFTLLIAANLISTVLECGTGECDDNPTFYQLLR